MSSTRSVELRGRRSVFSWDVTTVSILALACAAFPLMLPNGSFANYGFNGAVYLSSAVHLVHGVLPYRSYVLLHPPGIALVLSPLGLLSTISGTPAIWGLARLLVILVATANCTLVALLLRRFGPAASLTGGLFLATFSAAGLVTTQVKLEPFMLLFVLLGAYALFEEDHLATGNRALVAGLFVGFAGLIKIWAIFPALVLVVLVLWRQRSSTVRFCGGVVAGFCLPALPFVVAAPGAFVHDVFVTQLRRTVPSSQALTASQRLGTLSYDAFRPLTPSHAVAGWVGALVVLALTASVVHRRHQLEPVEWFGVAATVLSVASLLASAEYFAYYAYFPAVFFALVLGSAAGSAASWLARREGSIPGTRGRHRNAAIGLLIVILAVPFAVAQVTSTREALAPLRAPGSASVIASAIPPGACAVTNDAYTLLLSDRLSASRPGCPTVVDAEGLWLSLAPTSPPPQRSAAVPQVGAAWKAIFAGADNVVLNRYGDLYVPWTPSLRAWFAEHFVLVRSTGAVSIYRARS